MQRLNKRFYRLFVPYLVNEVKLYDMGNVSAGIVTFPGQNYLNILEASTSSDSLCNWKQLKLSPSQSLLDQSVSNEEEKSGQSSQQKDLRWPMWPKIIQVNANDIYVTGGNDSEIDSEEAGRDPNVLKTTLHISLKDSII